MLCRIIKNNALCSIFAVDKERIKLYNIIMYIFEFAEDSDVIYF
jgi:hypothetical protein